VVESVQAAIIRANIDDPQGHHGGRENAVVRLVAPELFAVGGVQGVEPVILRAYIDDFIVDGRRGTVSSFSRELSREELFPPIVSQISDMLNCEIGSEAFWRWVGRVVALHDENGGEAIPHDLLGSMQDVWVIVDHHIVIGGVGARDLIQVLLLMREDYDAPLNCL
jgi:hypothetical protein